MKKKVTTMSKYFLVSEHYAEIKRQLYADMKAQIELGETFHAVKGCINAAGMTWNDVPIAFVEISFCIEHDDTIYLLMWADREPDEDDFVCIGWPAKDVVGSWEALRNEVFFDLHGRKESRYE